MVTSQPVSAQPLSREEIAEQTIDFIENLGHPLVPWQAKMLRAMLKHDGPVTILPPPRKRPTVGKGPGRGGRPVDD